MRVMLRVCCGLDVHKRTVTACLLKFGAQGRLVNKETRTFATSTRALEELAQWLKENGCQHVAMESTGVYWKPVYNVLETTCEKVMLVNAQHIKNVPGRKTDVKDSQWIAELLAHGLLQASFVPPKEFRELRDLTRYRKTLINRRGDECNRIQKLLETGNVKLASVISDILGVSGTQMLEAFAEGETDIERMADMARGRMRNNIPQIKEALRGFMSENQRWLLAQQLEHVAMLSEQIDKLDAKVAELFQPWESLIEKLDAVPGINRRVAEVILAEIGVNMDQFGSAGRLASWAGICPGNHESAGKRRSGRRRKGNPWLFTALTEAGWAASKKKDSYLKVKHNNISRRRGKKRANVAIGHSLLTIVFHLLSDADAEYTDLGPEYVATQDKARLLGSLLRRINSLGFRATLEPAA